MMCFCSFPDSQQGIERLQKKQKDYARKCSVRYNYQGLSAREIGIRTYIYRLLFKYFNAFSSTDVYVRKTDELYREVSISDSDYICNFANWQGEKEYAPKFQYGEGVFMSFEGLEVRVPSKYDEYLTQKYGDWRADLPEDQKVGSHNFEILDLEKPYTHYVENF
jgi:phosphorylcholine metabolism protein LicD